MREITNAVQNEIASCGSSDVKAFREAAKQWASFAIDTYTEAFLTKALAVSKAIAEFCAVIEKDAPQER